MDGWWTVTVSDQTAVVCLDPAAVLMDGTVRVESFDGLEVYLRFIASRLLYGGNAAF
jgi:hypothetical protein